ncbi:MAG: TIGR02147 family protein [Deltaproteobacteria bacterium]|nr:TIGR02147 family protein [Deltaproteobacteria bacterium]
MQSVYTYDDYRAYLRDVIATKKRTSRTFSYRQFNQRAGLKSSGHLKLIIDGARNLSQETIYRLTRGLGLSEPESRFFESLVHFNQSKTHDEKDFHYQQLLTKYPPRHAQLLDADYYHLFSHWYTIAILELIRIEACAANAARIAKHLKPNVPANKIRQSLKLLEQSGMIRCVGARYERTEKMLTTSDAVRSLAVTKFHEQVTELALQALKHDPVPEKEFSSLTIAIAREDLPQLKQRIQEFRRYIHALIEHSERPRTDVAQLNIHLFTMTSQGDDV